MEEIYAPKQGATILIPSLIELERYLQNYQGNTRFNRLLHWMQQLQQLQQQQQQQQPPPPTDQVQQPSSEISILSSSNQEIYNLLVVEFLRSSNTTLFRKLVDDKILQPSESTNPFPPAPTGIEGGSGQGNNSPFEEWLSTTEKTLQTTLNILENELLTAKSTTVKESIRLAYCELGNLYYKWGKLDDSFKSFLRSRDYCSMPKHHSDIAYQLILLSFDMKQYYNANNFVNKLIDLSTSDSIMMAKGKVIQGLLFILNEGNYYYAATKFLEIISEIPNDEINYLISRYDIGFYTFVLCLATMNYSELKQKFANNKSFLNYYVASSTGPVVTVIAPESTPTAAAVTVPSVVATTATGGVYNPYTSLKLKQLLTDIINNSFESIFTSLPLFYTFLSSDIYFRHHASYLLKLIIEKIILQFLLPYQTISLEKIQSFFSLQTKQLKDLLISLISSGKLSAKIDSTNNLLIKNTIHIEKKLFDATHLLIEKNYYLLKRGLLRTSLQRYGFLIDQDQDQPMNMNKLKRLQEYHEQQHRLGRKGDGKLRGRRDQVSSGHGGGAAAHTVREMEEGDVSDHEDDLDEETLMAIAMSNGGGRVEQIPYYKQNSRGSDDYYSADEDM